MYTNINTCTIYHYINYDNDGQSPTMLIWDNHYQEVIIYESLMQMLKLHKSIHMSKDNPF